MYALAAQSKLLWRRPPSCTRYVPRRVATGELLGLVQGLSLARSCARRSVPEAGSSASETRATGGRSVVAVSQLT